MSDTKDMTVKVVLGIRSENLANAKHASCSTETWPEVNIDVAVGRERELGATRKVGSLGS